MITVHDLTKRHGRTLVLEGLTFDVSPGKVTGFLGPNGSGKSSTIRIMLGLDKPDSGVAWINGSPMRTRSCPLREVGFFLDADYVHPSRSPRSHLRALAASNGISKQRVDDVIEMVGLDSVAGQRLGTFSLGMKQRVGLAVAMLGDPPVMILDEPANGLDPEGAHWLRSYLTACAADGRTIFVSSHVLSEMALFVDHLVVIGQGKLLADESMDEFTSKMSSAAVVRSPRSSELADTLRALGAVVRLANGELEVDGWTPEQVGQVAFQHGFEIHGLWSSKASLETAFLDLTAQAQEFKTRSRRPGGA